LLRLLLFSMISSAAFLVAASQPQPLRRALVFEPNRGQAPARSQMAFARPRVSTVVYQGRSRDDGPGEHGPSFRFVAIAYSGTCSQTKIQHRPNEAGWQPGMGQSDWPLNPREASASIIPAMMRKPGAPISPLQPRQCRQRIRKRGSGLLRSRRQARI
jgi:hypothetical protein